MLHAAVISSMPPLHTHGVTHGFKSLLPFTLSRSLCLCRDVISHHENNNGGSSVACTRCGYNKFNKPSIYAQRYRNHYRFDIFIVAFKFCDNYNINSIIFRNNSFINIA
uniref:Uncharacterized protein n=1 Tax=Glossina pallidipes TaxID=7398 RepID=A0A1A9Z6U0_GLOPL